MIDSEDIINYFLQDNYLQNEYEPSISLDDFAKYTPEPKPEVTAEDLLQALDNDDLEVLKESDWDLTVGDLLEGLDDEPGDVESAENYLHDDTIDNVIYELIPPPEPEIF